MEIPKFHETFNPIIDILQSNSPISRSTLRTLVIEKYYSNLPTALLQATIASGDNLLTNRLNWGISYLKQAGYIINPSRGIVQITEKGLQTTLALDLKKIKSEIKANSTYQDQTDESDADILSIDTASPTDLITRGMEQIVSTVKNDLLEKLKTADPYYFERIVLILLNKMGYGDFIETAKSGDGGIDGIINEDKLGLDRIYIQAKRFAENKVREIDIRNFIGAMSGDTNKGVFVTTSKFDSQAIEKAKSAHHKIILIDGSKLVDLMYEYNVGVQDKQVFTIKQIDEDFFIEGE